MEAIFIWGTPKWGNLDQEWASPSDPWLPQSVSTLKTSLEEAFGFNNLTSLFHEYDEHLADVESTNRGFLFQSFQTSTSFSVMIDSHLVQGDDRLAKVVVFFCTRQLKSSSHRACHGSTNTSNAPCLTWVALQPPAYYQCVFNSIPDCWYWYVIQGASLRGRHTPPATLAQEGKIVWSGQRECRCLIASESWRLENPKSPATILEKRTQAPHAWVYAAYIWSMQYNVAL